jgi:hypothetical protein
MIGCILGAVLMVPWGVVASETQMQSKPKDVIVQSPGDGHEIVVLTRLGITPPLWVVPREDALAIREKLRVFLKVSNERDAGKVQARLDDYGIQYMGYTRDGTKSVYLSATCSSWFDRPDFDETHIPLVADGGPCFFEVRYDIDGGQFFGLFVHGSA